MPVGYVYVLSNQTLPGLVKIGYTTHSVDDRAAELSAATGVVGAFQVEYWRLTAGAEVVEQLAHEHFKNSRVNQKREFFRIDIDDAIEVLERHVTVPPTSYRRRAPAERQKNLPACRSCGHRFPHDFVNMWCPKCGTKWAMVSI